MVTVAAPDAVDRCPGALHAVAADDGLLLRVRVPGGYLGGDALTALATIAERDGDGMLDITARANVQLRGVREDRLTAAAWALDAAGLLPSHTHERIRNIAANPFAGLDPDECIDVRPLVAALDRALCAEPRLAALPAKVLFALDGGGRGAATDGADIAASASRRGGVVRFAVTGEDASPDEVDPDGVVAAMVTRAQRLLAPAGPAPHGVASAQAAADHAAATAPSRLRAMPGVYDAGDPETIALVPSVPLGRLHAAQARAVADFARAHGAGVRFAPWRGIVVGSLPRRERSRAYAWFARIGLPLDGRDGFVGLAACAGARACSASLADVRADAAAYAAAVAERLAPAIARGIGALPMTAVPDAPFTLEIAGCAKRCAMRHDAAATLVATGTGYDVLLRGRFVAHEPTGAALARVAAARDAAS
jgi:precorrin-3B synthase